MSRRSLKVMKNKGTGGRMVSGNVEGNLDICRRLMTAGESRGRSSRKQQEAGWEGTQRDSWIVDHDTFRGSIPSFFMREIGVVRLISLRCRGTVGPGHSTVCDFQDAHDLIAFMGFARTRRWRVLPAVAEFQRSELAAACRGLGSPNAR